MALGCVGLKFVGLVCVDGLLEMYLSLRYVGEVCEEAIFLGCSLGYIIVLG